MEFKRIAVCLAVLLALSEARHSRHRRQTYDENYDDTLMGDEANDEETQNDTDQRESPKPLAEPAVILTSPQKYEVDAGEDVRLECKVSPEHTVIQWYKNNQVYFLGTMELHSEAKGKYSIAPKSKDLIISKAQASDNGVFRCETVQEVPVSINHSVLVYEPPKVYDMTASNNGSVGEGQELSITCNVSGSPQPTVIWSITRGGSNQRLSEEYGTFSIRGNVFTLDIKQARPENSGQYYCYAFNKAGNHQSEVTVEVSPRPRVQVRKNVVNSAVKIEAILECAAHSQERPHFRWYKDDKRIELTEPNYVISTHGLRSNLTVTPAGDEDFGTFTCEAENLYGVHNRSIELVQNPVVEDVQADGSKISWVVHSHQPIEEMEVQLRGTQNETEVEFKRFAVPLPEGHRHRYDISYSLDNQQLQSGEYSAIVKVKNTKAWGGSNEPVQVKIENPQPQFIQHASVFSTGAGHSIRPVGTLLATVLMYLLVRMI